MLDEMPRDKLERFFRADASSYVLAKEVRDLCIFSAHSVIRDPPFSRRDLISCRNLLIYFNAELQDNVLPVFHYALKPGGYLFLGPSQSASRHSELFSSVDKKQRIFHGLASMNNNDRLPSWIAQRRDSSRAGAESGMREDQGPHRHPSGDIAGLEIELRETRERLQSTVEEYETVLEELVCINEELQSTNEELETSKEELQSVNEEMHTVNNELGIKVEELHRSNADLRNLFESTQIATVFLDRHMMIRSYTPAVTAIFNLISTDRGRPLLDIAHQLEDLDLQGDVRRVLDEHEPIERPVRTREDKVDHLMRILPYRTADEEIDGVLVTFVDVTAVVEAEEKQRVLVAELNHRVRNMLQVVIGLGNQTLHRSASLQEFEKSFMGRMQALARAYELLSRDGWHNVAMTELLRSQLAPFASEDDRYSVEGKNVLLTANAALAMGLVVYELAANATKYGALSTPNGHVHVSWQLNGKDTSSPDLVLRWNESGGPPVHAPQRQGFGSELMQRQLKYELNGQAAMEFAESGLRVTLVIPVAGAVLGGSG